MEIKTIKEVVDKLIGGIEPIGSTGIDDLKHQNLLKQTQLVFELVLEIKDVAIDNMNRYEYSMKRSGLTASNFLQSLVNELGEYGFKQKHL